MEVYDWHFLPSQIEAEDAEIMEDLAALKHRAAVMRRMLQNLDNKHD